MATAAVSGLVVVVVLVVALDLLVPQPRGAIRPRSLRNRVECLLEDWRVIKLDPFRHIEG